MPEGAGDVVVRGGRNASGRQRRAGRLRQFGAQGSRKPARVTIDVAQGAARTLSRRAAPQRVERARGQRPARCVIATYPSASSAIHSGCPAALTKLPPCVRKTGRPLRSLPGGLPKTGARQLVVATRYRQSGSRAANVDLFAMRRHRLGKRGLRGPRDTRPHRIRVPAASARFLEGPCASPSPANSSAFYEKLPPPAPRPSTRAHKRQAWAAFSLAYAFSDPNRSGRPSGRCLVRARAHVRRHGKATKRSYRASGRWPPCIRVFVSFQAPAPDRKKEQIDP